jgi:uncharacterized DUF497 family protein
MKFEWDPNKASHNLKIHKVTFTEATTVFNDPLSTTYPDPDHSYVEDRFISIGLSNQNRLLIVSHTDRNEITRIISA